MDPFPCPHCGSSNPAANEYCGRCGAALREQALIVRNPAPLQISSGERVTPQVKALAVTVALGMATVLAEASLAYVQRKLADRQRPSFRLGKKKDRGSELVVRPKRADGGVHVVTIVSERVTEETRWGRPIRRVVERFAWRAEERIE
jgi:hypothetical protein